MSAPSSSLAKKDDKEPSVTATKFANSPYDLRYFDDSDVILMQDYTEDAVYRSDDAGESWAKVNDIPGGKAWSLIMHPFDNKSAYVLTEDTTHWRTEDRGNSWTEFLTKASPDARVENPLNFHAGDNGKILMNAMDCLVGVFCESMSVYTTDGFRTDAKALREGTLGCNWAKGTEIFAERHTGLKDDRILCVVPGQFMKGKAGNKLVVSDDFFETEFEPPLETDRTVNGIAKIAAVKGYILAAGVAERTDEMALYVTSDAEDWHRAVFPSDHKMVEEAYTILESTNYSIQIDVMTTKPSSPMGVLLSSNSNGTYFTRNLEHTNRNSRGNVDFEKVAGVQGIALVNVVDNWEDVEEKARKSKKIKSQISFDDGRTWQALKTKDEDDLHIHSVTAAANSGRIFSSLAPGLMMGVGNTGKHLKDYDNGDTYVSEDAGVTWKKALDGPHKYEFGDSGSILVAIPDEITNKLKYSLNRGRDWETVELKEKVSPYVLTTTLDSTSLKFLLVATAKPNNKEEYYIMSIDFDKMDKRTCKDDDLEKWYARVDSKGEPTCLMGHKQFYMRRKADADCFVKRNFVDPTPEFVECDCEIDDYECDFNFVRNADRKECVLEGPLVIPEGACKKPEDTFKGSSGWRKIPGDKCKDPKSGAKDEPVDRKCDEAHIAPPANGKVSHSDNKLSGKRLMDHMYFERTETSSGDDETVIAQTDKGVYLSRDHGKTWKEILQGKDIQYIVRHKYLNDRVFFIATDGHVYYSLNRGDNIQKFDTKVPHKADWRVATPMTFHPTRKDWIIWTGVDGSDKHAIASISRDRGDSWETLARYVRKCEFIYDEKNTKQKGGEKLIMCQQKNKESPNDDNNPWKLVSSTDLTFEETTTIYDDILDFATMSEFIIVANKNKEQELNVAASVDGKHFAPALFPANFHVPHQHGYTVLDSSTHAIFLHVTVDTTEGAEYGGIIKSNSNGTSYVLSLNGVNRDAEGYVDFEKMSKLEGVALANVVTNYQTAAKDNTKILRTMITHNDGAEWRYITPPSEDIDLKPYACKGDLEKCSLNLHGYTERMDKSHTYSSPSAVGIMLAVGNVGGRLESFDKSDTYLTKDGGISWQMVKRGSYMWEYGDQGSIIVLVSDREPTNVVYYTHDEGITWDEYKFSEPKLNVYDITTLPSDNSRNFLLWTNDGDELKTINLDYTGLTDRQCKLDESDSGDSDYELWSPRHPTQDNDCLFGHIAQYHRKKPSADCFNGHLIEALHDIKQNCTCTRQDFECDYNYQALPGGECLLVEGLEPPNRIQDCYDDSELVEYFEPTGYRHIPLSTCEGGPQMDKITPKPCPGKEEEYNKKRGLGGFWIFLIVLSSVGTAAAVGFWVWRNWEGKFGQIRLGEQCKFSPFRPEFKGDVNADGDAASFNEKVWYVKYPVLVVAGIGAVIIATPSVVSSLWGWVSSKIGRGGNARFTSRRSFARGPHYEAVNDDEGELLGDDSEEEV